MLIHMGYYSYLKQEAREAEAEEQAPKKYAKGGSVKNLKAAAQELKQMGRGGDTDLVHVNEYEKEMLKMMGGSVDINPRTGLREYVKSTILPPLLRNRKEQLQSFAANFPAQVGNTCSLQNAYHLTNFVKSLPTTTKSYTIGSDIIAPEDCHAIRSKDAINTMLRNINESTDLSAEDKKSMIENYALQIDKKKDLDADIGDYIRNLSRYHLDLPLKEAGEERTPHKEIETFIEQILSNPEGFNNRETSTTAFLKAMGINTDHLKSGSSYNDVMGQLEAHSSAYMPVIYNGDVHYPEQKPSGHSLVFLKTKEYGLKAIEEKIDKYKKRLNGEELLKEKTAVDKSYVERQNTKLQSFQQMKQNKLPYRSKIFDPNTSTQDYSKPIFDELLFNESGKGYRTSDLLNIPEPQPFINLATKPRFTKISGYIDKDGVEKPVY